MKFGSQNEKFVAKNKYYNGNIVWKLIINCCSLEIALLKELIALWKFQARTTCNDAFFLDK